MGVGLRRFLAMCASLVTPVTAFATTYTIYPDGSGDFPTIQAAIDATADGDEILLADGVYEGEGNQEIQVPTEIILRGASGDPDAVIINCATNVGFNVEAHGQLDLQALTIEHGTPAVKMNGDSGVNATNSVFRTNDGCLHRPHLGSSISVEACKFVSNRGVGVLVNESNATFVDTEFVDNTGICVSASYLVGVMLFDRCSFRGNGFLLNVSSEYDDAYVRITNSEFLGNGGGIQLNQVQSTMEDCLVRGNANGIRAYNVGSFTVRRTEFIENGNHAAHGGALSIGEYLHAIIVECDFIGNVAGFGGAITVDGGSLSATRCLFRDNRATSAGGAIRVEKDADGGGLTDCVFTSNQAGVAGGAISLDLGDPFGTTRCSIVACAAPSGSALHSVYSNGIRLVDTVIAENLGSMSTIEVVAKGPWSSVPEIEGCTIVRNRQTSGACLTLDGGVIERTIVAFNQCASFAPLGDSLATFACSDIYGNSGGDWVVPISSQLGESGNIACNPLFCDLAQGDFTLASLSPCLDENNDAGCPTMGAFPEAGCLEPAPIVFSIRPDGSGDYATIQAALDFAADRDTVSLADGVYSGPGNRDLNYHGKELVVRSESGTPADCVIDCDGASGDPHRGFVFVSGETAASVLEGVTITGGAAFGQGVARFGGGIYCAESSPTIQNCILEGNAAQRNGGAINLFHSNTLIENCTVRGNEAPLGAGISSSSSTPTIRSTQITGNVASESGGGVRYFAQLDGSPQIESTTISGNESPLGGGVECVDEISLQVDRSIVWDNCADQGAEFRLADAGSSVTLTCSDVDTSGVWLGDLGAEFVFEGGDNISLDPEFCDPLSCTGSSSTAGSFTLDAGSPCSPSHSPQDCDLIGALSVYCDATAEVPGVLFEEDRLVLRSYPNPFSRSTVLRFQLPADGSVEVTIYDIAGKRVRSLEAGMLEAGIHVIDWDGTNEGGHLVPDGVYLCRVVSGSYSTSTSLTVVGR